MTTHVISLRLPSAMNTALARSAAQVGLSVPDGLDWLLRYSFANCSLLGPLADCPDFLDAKLDVRIPITTSQQLKVASNQMGIPVSVYIRKLLYHFFVTQSVKYVPSDSRYTLAGRHD